MQDIVLRALRSEELAEASALCLRSKAHWGYDAAFIDACRDELTLTDSNLSKHPIMAACWDGQIVGIAELTVEGNVAELEKMFVEPALIGKGVGKGLFRWVREFSLDAGLTRIFVSADPYAVPFYLSLGFQHDGEQISSSIPGRVLPRLAMALDPAS